MLKDLQARLFTVQLCRLPNFLDNAAMLLIQSKNAKKNKKKGNNHHMTECTHVLRHLCCFQISNADWFLMNQMLPPAPPPHPAWMWALYFGTESNPSWPHFFSISDLWSKTLPLGVMQSTSWTYQSFCWRNFFFMQISCLFCSFSLSRNAQISNTLVTMMITWD